MARIHPLTLLLLALLGSEVISSAATAQSLPPDVPPYTYARLAPVSPGMLLVSASPLTPTAAYPSSLMMIDTTGTLVFYLNRNSETAAPYASTRLSDFLPDDDGHLHFNADDASGERVYFRMDSTLSLVDSIGCVGLPLDGHDFVVTPDGHFHIFCEFDSLMDLSAFTTTSGAPGLNPGIVRVQNIVELDASGAVLYEWNPLYRISLSEMNLAYFNDSSLFDLTHYNSLDVDSLGNYLISSRHLDQVQYLEKATGDFIWRMGGVMNDFTLVGDSVWFTAQHQARFLPGGRVSLFDNATTTPSGIARGIEYAVDTAAMTLTPTWVQPNIWGLRSLFIGSHQRMPDGHRLIGWGGMFPLTTSLTAQEFLPTHAPAMRFDLPAGWISYRVNKRPLAWALPRPTITCDADSLQLIAEPGWSHYYWSTGDSGQIITIADTGRYQVWVDYGAGRLSSEVFEVNDIANPCGGTGTTAAAETATLQLHPNPTQGEVTLTLPNGETEIWLIDPLGRTHRHTLTSGSTLTWSLHDLSPGTYTVRMSTGKATHSKLLVVL